MFLVRFLIGNLWSTALICSYVWSETDLAKPSISAISVRLLVCFGHLHVASVFPRQAMAGMLAACYQQSTNNVHI